MDLVAYGESYNQAMQGIEDMLLQEENPMASFKKNVYPEAFQAYLRRHMDTIQAIEAVYQQEENPAAWTEKLAERLVTAAQKVDKSVYPNIRKFAFDDSVNISYCAKLDH